MQLMVSVLEPDGQGVVIKPVAIEINEDQLLHLANGITAARLASHAEKLRKRRLQRSK